MCVPIDFRAGARPAAFWMDVAVLVEDVLLNSGGVACIGYKAIPQKLLYLLELLARSQKGVNWQRKYQIVLVDSERCRKYRI